MKSYITFNAHFINNKAYHSRDIGIPSIARIQTK